MTLQDIIAVAGLAVLLIGVFAWLRRSRPAQPQVKARHIAVDGTNVLFWRDEQAQLQTLKTVLTHLHRIGFTPVVFLDASSRHHLGDKSLNPDKFAKVLDVPRHHIMVCPKGTEADGYILSYAQEHKLTVVSNDRFRDRPQAARTVRLVKGRFEGKRLVLKGL